MNTRYLKAVATTLFCIGLLSGCATPGSSVILLPQPDGQPSAVFMKAKGGESVVNKPFQRARTNAGSITAPWITWENLTQLRAAYPSLFELMPAPAERFELFFNTGGTALERVSQRALAEIISSADRRIGSDLVVTGHTDTAGTARTNDELSLRRAVLVKQLLVQLGVRAEHIETVGRGTRDLAVPTADGVDEPRNRRVTVVVR